MNISGLFIRRPVTTTLVMVGNPDFRDFGLQVTGGQRFADCRFSNDHRQR